MVAVVLAANLSGCLWLNSSDEQVPYPRLGDRVEFVQVTNVTGLYENEKHIVFQVEELLDLKRPDGTFVPSIRISMVTVNGEGGGKSYRQLYVSETDHRLERVTTECVHSELSGCSPVEHAYSINRLPWGLGSSLFHGFKLNGQGNGPIEVMVGGEPIILTPGVVDTSNGGSAESDVQLSLPNGLTISNSRYYDAFAGNFTLDAASPYVESASFGYEKWIGIFEAYFEVNIKVTQSSYTPGEGPVLMPSGQKLSEPQCLPTTGPMGDGLPPDSDVMVPPLRVSFGEFLDPVKDDDSQVRDRLNNGGYVANQWITQPTSKSEPDMLGFGDHETSGRVYVHGPEDDLKVFEVERTEEMSPLGDETTYNSDLLGETHTDLRPDRITEELVSMEALLERHFATVDEQNVDIVRFAVESGIISENGHPKDRRPQLMVGHGTGAPMAHIAYTYDLGSGCLVEHKTGEVLDF